MTMDCAMVQPNIRDLGLQAAQLRAKVRTTVPAEDLGERPDLLGRNFTAQAQDVSGAGIFPRKREVPPPTSGPEPGLSIVRPFWTAVPRKS